MITALFFGVGWLVDNWLGTVPVFMIVFTVLAAVGLFTKSKYRYDARRWNSSTPNDVAAPHTRHRGDDDESKVA